MQGAIGIRVSGRLIYAVDLTKGLIILAEE
jgi:hypothetical protein